MRVARLAFEYRQQFHKDVVIDMVVLPPPRPQRGRRPELHAAADVQGDRRAPQRAQAVRRGAREARRHHARRGRAGARRLPGQAAGRARRDPCPGAPTPVKAAKPPKPRRRAAAHRRRVSSGPTLDAIFDHLTDVPGVVHAAPQAGPPVRDPGQAVPRERRGRLGDGRGAGVRLAAARGHAGPPRRRGHPPRHVQPAPRRARSTTRPGKPWIPLDDLPGRRGHVLGLRLAAVGVRRARLRVRLRPRQPRGARAVGGAVRRLHQRRPDHHRPVPRRRRGQVGPAQRPRAAPAARLRGPGPRALVGPHRALPHAVRRGQHPGLQRHDGGAVLPPAAPPGAHASVHTPLSCSRRSRRCG